MSLARVTNPERFYLGPLCKRGHEHQDGQSLRLKSNTHCVSCRKESEARYQQTDKYKEKHKRAIMRYRATDVGREKVSTTNARYQASEKGKRAHKKYTQSERGYVNNARAAAGRRLCEDAVREFYSLEELKSRFAIFGNKCAYCGESGKLHIDHVVALSQGGDDVLSNIVPACQSCNSSKHTKAVGEWYPQRPYFTQERFNKILNR